MSEADLIQETNQLMRRILDIEDERRLEAKQREKVISVFDEKSEEGEIWGTRLLEAQEKATRATLELQDKDELYRMQLLAELQKQSELLRRIAEKLGV